MKAGLVRIGKSRGGLLALVRFEQARRGLLPLAEARGILTDEDVFALVS